MRIGVALASAGAATLLGACSGEGWTLDFGNRNNGVIGSGNAGRILVSTLPGLADSTSDTAYLYRATDSIPDEVGACPLPQGASCGFELPLDVEYRAEIRSAGRLTARTAWVRGAGKDLLSYALSPARPVPFRFRFVGVSPDSVLLGTRRGIGAMFDSAWTCEGLRDSADTVWIHRPGVGWMRARLGWNASVPVLVGDPSGTAHPLVAVEAVAGNWFDAAIIGIPGSTGSGYENDLYGTDTTAGLGGAWDPQTVGRTLVRIPLPGAVQGRSIRSARLEYRVANWGIRPTGSRGFRVEAHVLRRSWNEASAGYATPNTAALNGATALEATFGNSWKSPLVALDGTDADAVAAGGDSIPYLSSGSVRVDLRSAVQAWASGTGNFGVVLRDVHEAAGDFLDYPVFWTKEARDPMRRPRLLIELAP